jgi:hypothetical protein
MLHSPDEGKGADRRPFCFLFTYQLPQFFLKTWSPAQTGFELGTP